MKNGRTQRKLTLTQWFLAKFLSALFCMSIAGLAEGAVVVLDAYVTVNVALSDPLGELHYSYSGSSGGGAYFNVPDSGTNPIDAGAIGANAGYGVGYGNMNQPPSGPALYTTAFSAVEHRDTRIAQADAVWEFDVTDFNTSFSINALWEIGHVSCILEDLTSGSVVATYGGGGSSSPYGGSPLMGILLQGHSYRLTQSARINGYSDESAKIAFSVGTDVVFQLPQVVIEQPAGSNVGDGGSRNFGVVPVGASVSLIFTVRNTGVADVTGLAVIKDGTNPGDFTIGSLGGTSLAPEASTTFTVTFTPSATGLRAAAIQIASNETERVPVDITLRGSMGQGTYGDFTYTDNGTSITITDYATTAVGDVVIPATINGNPVISVDSSAFSGCSGLTSVTIPAGVTSIGNSAFNGCSELTSVTIPKTVTSIGDSAFSGCKQLQSATIPLGVTRIGANAFYGCSGLTNVTIQNRFGFRVLSRVTSIGDSAFYGCSGLTSVTIPYSVTSIGNFAFYGCNQLTSVTIPWDVRSIGFSAFSSCSKLTSIFVEANGNPNFSSVGGVLFDKLKTSLIQYPGGRAGSYTIPNSVTGIEHSAFRNCAGLTKVTIPNSVTSIGASAFELCSGLKDAIFMGVAPSMGSGVFGSVASGFAIYYPYGAAGFTTPTWQGYPAFPSLAATSFTYTDNGTSIIITDYPNTAIGDLVIPATIDGKPVTGIGGSAFHACTGLTSVTIPASVTSIGIYALSGCTSLTQITVDALNPAYVSVNGVLFNKALTTLIHYPAGKAGSYTIPTSVTNIGADAFYDCAGLTGVTIPNSVTSIGTYAFQSCTGLSSVTIPNSVTSIGNEAFDQCSGLTSVTIPSSVSSIGSYAFRRCYGLEQALFMGNAPVMGSGVFGSVAAGFKVYYPYGAAGFTTPSWLGYPAFPSLEATSFTYADDGTSVTITDYPNAAVGDLVIPAAINGKPVTGIGPSAFSGCSGLTSVMVPSSVTIINDYAFYGCSGLTSVGISVGLTEIGAYAFYECTKLTSVVIPSGVTRVGSYSFFGCTGLTSMTIPGSVVRVSMRSFSGCSGLTSVTIQPGPTSIQDYAFSGCTSLTSVSIPASVTDITEHAFDGCIGLTSVTIPASVTGIESRAFLGCSGLKEAFFMGNAPGMGSDVFGSCASGFTVYYPSGAVGFSTPTWLGTYTAFPISAPNFTSAAPPSKGEIGIAYHHACTSTSMPPPVFAVTSGSLPDGLTLSGAGVIAGTPTSEGVFTGAITASNGTLPDATQAFSITIHGDYTLATGGEHGTVAGGGVYLPQATATLTASPDPGYVFANWSGDASGSVNPLVVLMTTDKTITAVFSPDLSDDDNDGLSNYQEIATYGTNPALPDTDGDGIGDKAEIDQGRNPLKIETTVTLASIDRVYDGSPIAATASTSIGGLQVDLRYNGNATPPVNAGNYTVVATINDLVYTGTSSGTLVIAKATSTVTLGNLGPTYDGTSKQVSVTTVPAGLAFTVTYDGQATLPMHGGSYVVEATVNDANHAGGANGVLVISKADQTLTFAAIPNQNLDQATVMLAATSSSGLAPEFSVVSGPATVTGATLTLTGPGVVVVQAAQLGNADWNAAPTVQQFFQVSSGDFDQDFVWAKGFGGGSADTARGIATDSLGNALVAVDFTGTVPFGAFSLTASGGSSDLALVKVAADGTVLSASRFGGSNSDNAKVVTVDATNQTILGGEFLTSTTIGGVTQAAAGSTDISLLKVDAAGSLLWSKRFGGTSADSISGLATDPDGNILIAGDFSGSILFGATTLTSNGGRDGFVAKLDPSGTPLWAINVGGTGNDSAYAVAVTPTGQIFVGGSFSGTASFGAISRSSAGGTDGFAMGLSPAGAVQWATRFGGGSNDAARSVAVDVTGAACVAGNFAGTDAVFGTEILASEGGDDAFVVRLAAVDGAILNASQCGGTGMDAGLGLAADPFGGLYLSGSYTGKAYFDGETLTTSQGPDGFVAKLDTGGNFLWAMDGSGASSEQANCIATNAGGHVFVAGLFSQAARLGSHDVTAGGGVDLFVAKINGPAPSFAASPAMMAVDEGEPFTIAAPAAGAGPITYQWFKDGGILEGKTGSILQVSAASASDQGVYHVVATNIYGSSALPSVTVTVLVPVRVLTLDAPAASGENRTLEVPMYLDSEGEVTGLTVELPYNRDLLRNPSFVRGPHLSSANSSVVVDTAAGTVRVVGSAFPSSIPEGHMLIGTFKFTTRSVPEQAIAVFTPSLASTSDIFGAALDGYTKLVGDQTAIARREIPGDANNNGRLDVSDAAELIRLYANPSQIRTWDHYLNDLNLDGVLTEGDATRVLRVVTKRDSEPSFPQSMPVAGLGQPALQWTGSDETAVNEQDNPEGLEPVGAPLLDASARLVLTRLTGANANKVLAQVFLDNVPAGQAGISFRVDYPASVLRIVGASSLIVPAGGLPSGNTAQWNVFPGNDYANQTGSVSLAAAWGSAWTFTAGQSVANLVFELQPTVTGQVHFALTLAETETGPYDAGGPSTPLAVTGQVVTFSRSYADWALATLGNANAGPDDDNDGDGMSNALEFSASTNPADANSRLQTTSGSMTPGGYALRWFAAYGVAYRVRWSSDLMNWNNLTGPYIGTGAETEAIDPSPPAAGRLYRVEVLQP